MKVFVTGGTGFVGQEIVQQLRAQGDTPVLLVRKPTSRSSKAGNSFCIGDVLGPSGLAECMQGADAVIHLVGIISEVGKATFENVHTRGTQNVVSAAKAAKIDRLVHMSALGTRPNAVSRYHRSKWAAEERVRRSGLNYTIFRPSLIFGPQDHFVNTFARMMKLSPVVPVMGRRGTRFQPVHVKDVAAAFVRSLKVPEAIGATYDLCGPDTLTMPEILKAIGEVTARRRLQVRVPEWLAKAQAAMLESLFPLVGKAPPLNRDQLVMLNEDNVGDGLPAQRVFGIEPTRFRDGIASYLR